MSDGADAFPLARRIIYMKKIIPIFIALILSGCSSMDNYHKSIEKQVSLSPITMSSLQDERFNAKIAFLYHVLANTHEVHIHQMNGEIHNEVYLAKDGHGEVVIRFQTDKDGNRIDGTGTTLTDHPNQGSYNYFHPENDPLRHFTYDSLPWLDWGAIRNDPTTVEQRVHAYILDLSAGLDAAYANRSSIKLPIEFTLAENGKSQAIAFLLSAMDVGGVDLEIFTNINVTGKERQEFLDGLERGIITLLNGN